MSYTPIRRFGLVANYHSHAFRSTPHTHTSGCGWGNVPSYSPTYPSDYPLQSCGLNPCRCYPPRQPSDLNSVATMLKGRHINTAVRIYNNIRVVIRDGENLMVTADYVQHRINVEISNNIIVRIVGFY